MKEISFTCAFLAMTRKKYLLCESTNQALVPFLLSCYSQVVCVRFTFNSHWTVCVMIA